GKVSEGGAGCADCHHNGNSLANGVPNDTFQDFNIHEPGVISESTVDGKGPFFRPENDYFFEPFAPPQDVGTPQNFSSRNTKHLRALWDAVPKYLHYGFAHTLREVLLAPDSPLLRPGERGFNFRTVRLDQSRPTATSFLGGPPVVLPTQVPITFADSSGSLAGDGKGQILVSLDSPFATEPDGTVQIDRLGTSNLMPLMSGNQINPALAANNIQVIRDTHGKTSHLSAADLDALILYLKSLDRKTAGAISIPEYGGPGPSPTPTVSPSATPTPSPGPSVNATPSPGATSSPTATASASASPSATPSVSPKKSGGRALNISTRLKVETGDNAMIGGFIVTGNAPKKLLVRAIGPSLSQVGISGALSDPVLELHGDGGTLLTANDNWKDDPVAAEAIRQSGAAPQNERESAVVVTLAPGSYTAVVSGKNGATGTGLIEIYDLEETGDCELANISTRGLVQSGEDVMIGGFVLGGANENTRVLVRAIGPSLAKFGINGALSDPMLELHDGNGALLQRNHDWRDQQETEIAQTGVAPRDNAEAAILANLAPGAYTAVVSGQNGQTGVALVEVFALH
ncbi:MAG: hypothetical protein QOG12_1566, partial [Verrucomicrobiota bacterium]